LEFIPTDTPTLEDLGSGPLYYHVSCYRLFTDVAKLRRAKKNAESPEKSRTDYQADPSTSNYSRRRSARNGPILNTLLSKRPKKDVLPNFCLICKIPGPIWTTDKVTDKRKKQEMTLAQTVTVGLLKQATERKKDESILVHIWNKDCVAVEARYHRKCYYKYVCDGPTKTTEGEDRIKYDKAFETFCVNVVDKRLIQNKEILLLTFLVKKFNEAVRDVEGVDISYQSSHLKARIGKKYPNMVFHTSKTMQKGTLVYSPGLTVGEIADDSLEFEDEVESDYDDECCDEMHTQRYTTPFQICMLWHWRCKMSS